MAHELVMPKWGLTMKSGKIARWLVQEGASVEVGTPLLEVETDKITNVVESPVSGVLLQICAAPGDTVPVMEVIGLIGEAGEAPASPSAGAAQAAPENPAPAAAPAAAAASAGSAQELVMPKWGLTMKTGKLSRWLVKEGDTITVGMPVAEVETDKITNVIESPLAGTLLQILEQEGANVPVMQAIALIGEAGAQGAASAVTSAKEIKAMPAARKLAKDLGVDLACVTGTGRGGAITMKDVQAYHDNPPAAPAAAAPAAQAAPADKPAAQAAPAAQASEDAAYTIIPMEGLRKLIADNMQASLQSAAQLSIFVEVDVTEMVELRNNMLAKHAKDPDYKLSYNDIIAFAVCRALKQHPIMNSTLHEDGIHVHKNVHLGIAVSLENGLIVPNVKNADCYSLEELKSKVRDVAARARKGGLSMDEISGGSFTISNVSMMGVDGFTPILNPPETGILGVGRVVEKPGVYQGQICLRKMQTLSLTFNHMVTDGGPAMNFLRTLADMLEKPLRMLA